MTSRAQTPTVPKTETVESSSSRILVVEDHADTVKMLARLLKLSGYQVKTAGSVTEATEIAGRETFDLLVSDIGLPDGTGYDLLERLQTKGPIKAIAMSGFGMDEDLRRSREAGFSEHVVKPVQVSDLEDAIKRVLGESK